MSDGWTHLDLDRVPCCRRIARYTAHARVIRIAFWQGKVAVADHGWVWFRFLCSDHRTWVGWPSSFLLGQQRRVRKEYAIWRLQVLSRPTNSSFVLLTAPTYVSFLLLKKNMSLFFTSFGNFSQKVPLVFHNVFLGLVRSVGFCLFFFLLSFPLFVFAFFVFFFLHSREHVIKSMILFQIN